LKEKFEKTVKKAQYYSNKARWGFSKFKAGYNEQAFF